MKKKNYYKKEKVKKEFLIIFIFLLLVFLVLFSFINLRIKKDKNIFYSPQEVINETSKITNTYIYEGSPYLVPNENLDSFFVGKFSDKNMSSLIYFDISSVPQNVYILSAYLSIEVKSINGESCGNLNIKVSRVTSYWNRDYTSWIARDSNLNWSSQGGDYIEDLSDPYLVINSIGNYSFNITNIFKHWYQNPNENYGIIIYQNTTNNCVLSISSKYSDTNVPTLRVNYTYSAPPTITNVYSNAQSIQTIKNLNENVSFWASWSDDGSYVNLFICNSSQIQVSGCTHRTFCSSIQTQQNPASCNYSVSVSDNRTIRYYAGICDESICVISTERTFFTNRPANIVVTNPNISETIRVGTIEYPIRFNYSDLDRDSIKASIYFGPEENLTEETIVKDLSLGPPICTDSDNNIATPNNCTYIWNPSGRYKDNVYISVVLFDGYSFSQDSSDEKINIRTLDDPWPPHVSNPIIPQLIYSGEDVIVNVTARDDQSSIKMVWVSINTTPPTNVSLNLYEGSRSKGQDGFYSGVFVASEPKSYKITAYAMDEAENINYSEPIQFIVYKPEPEIKTPNFPERVLPYHLIKISGSLNPQSSMKGVRAFLNIPENFSFINSSAQNLYLGNFTKNQEALADWYLSTPIRQGIYKFNITYFDQYMNVWTTNSYDIQVTNDFGSGILTPSIEIIGYPVVSLNNDYYAEIKYKKGGTLTNADKVEVILFDPLKQINIGPVIITNNPSIGVYNFTRKLVGMTGQWEILVNITDGINNYYANEFFTLISGIFDVRNIKILNPRVSSLNISFEAYNKGEIPTDLWVYWNLTDSNGRPIPGERTSGDETIGVDPGEVKTIYIHPKTTYTGQAKISIIGKYGENWEKEAGASSFFTIEPDYKEEKPTSSLGGSSDQQLEEKEELNKSNEKMENFDIEVIYDKTIYVAEGINKTTIIDIKNKGRNRISNVFIEIEGINSTDYFITPSKVPYIDPLKKESFYVTFNIKEKIEKAISFKIKSDEGEIKEYVFLISFNIRDFLSNEAIRIKNLINSLLTDKKSEEELKKCQNILKEAEKEIISLNVMSAKEKLEEAEKCIREFREKYDLKKQKEFSKRELTILIILTILVLILIAILVYLAYVRIRILNFIKAQKEMQNIQTEDKKEEKKESEFDKKIEKIKKILEE